MKGGLSIDLDKILMRLLCGYAFFIPLEHILEVFFQVDTILKPYRIFAILIILVFVLRSFFRLSRNTEISEDKYLYFVFLYGTFITLIRMITDSFDVKLLFNDVFQLMLYFGVFVVVRHLSLTKKDAMKILSFLALGVAANSVYIFFNFFILRNFGRTAGFMDNPNYLAFGIQIVIVLMIVSFSKFKGVIPKLLWLLSIFFLGYIFIISGSRTGLLLLMVSIMIILFFSSLKLKAMLLVIIFGTGAFLVLNDAKDVDNAGPLILVNRIQQGAEREDNRIPIWEGVLRASESTNFAGIGIGQFKARFREFYDGENNSVIRGMLINGYFLSPHSDYLLLLVVYGVVGLMSYLIFLFLSLRKVFYKFIDTEEYQTKQFYQFGFLMCVSLLLFGITNANIYNPLFWIMLSICTRVQYSEEEVIAKKIL